jgi:hypothetical protein
MQLTRKNVDDVKITILIELYSGIYLSSDRIDMGAYIFDNYTELKNLPERENLFTAAFLELQDLKLVDCSSICRNNGAFHPRITGSGVQILDVIFMNNSFDDFIKNDQKESRNLKEIITDKAVENGVEKVISYLLSLSVPAYNLVIQGVNNLPLI